MIETYQPYFELDGNIESGLLIVCDHARNTLPAQYGSLGLPESAFERHIAYDIGVEAVVRQLSESLNCPAVLSDFSRLLIDPNRGSDDPTLVMRLSDGQVIPSNHPLSDNERQYRTKTFHQPYHAAITAQIDRFLAAGISPAIFSVHSFTHAWKGVARPWHVAMLADVDTGFHSHMLSGLRDLPDIVVGYNEPDDAAVKVDCMQTHGIRRGVQHALVELRQDLIGDEAGQARWAKLLAPILKNFADDPANRERRYFSSRTGSYIKDDGKTQN